LVVLVPVEVPPPVVPVPPVPLVPPEEVPPVEAPELGAAGVTGVLVAPLLGVLVPDEPLELVLDGVEVEDGVELEASAVVEVPSPEEAAAPPIDVLSGAISATGFFGTTSCVTLPPPQADSPPVARSSKATAVARRRMGDAL
jgi:hypothetical protein